MDAIGLLLALAAGFFSGLTASMGLGGGFVLLICLTGFMGVPQTEAQWINLIFFLPVAALSLVFHRKNGLLQTDQLLPPVLGGLIGAMLGVSGARLLGDANLSKLFAVFLAVIGLRELFSGFSFGKSRLKK
ncbi:MAG: sulfite exporter TauE/SafE family protein [Oscillospiraceae bacterium]|nr:sulfite exporter TauE/SafE family protein [Oscillospiraceae bacterium]